MVEVDIIGPINYQRYQIRTQEIVSSWYYYSKKSIAIYSKQITFCNVPIGKVKRMRRESCLHSIGLNT